MNFFLEKDRSKAFVVDITPLGLMEITRKSSGGLVAAAAMHERCVYCGGKGVVKDSAAVCSDILAELKAAGSKNIGGQFAIEVSSALAGVLNGEAKGALSAIAEKYQLKLNIIVRSSISKGSFLITPYSAPGM
jgi:ribonuclease G